MRRTLGPLILVAIALAGLIWLRPHHPPSPPSPPSPPAATTSAPSIRPAVTVPPSTLTPRPESAPPATSSTAATTPSHALRGRPLAEAWLTGYLTRSNRDDNRWVDPVRPLSSPELVAELEDLGPDAVGLDRLTSWRVAKIEAYQPVDQPVDTPSRMVLAYAATVTDGHTAIEKPFAFTSYLQPDGRWIVTSLDQPYSSEG